MDKLRILMLGPHLSAKGGSPNVVNNWIEAGIKDKIDLHYISTINDLSPKRYITKFLDAALAYILLTIKTLRIVDIVHIHMSSYMSFFRKWFIFTWAKLMKIKTIVHIHGSMFEKFYYCSNSVVKSMITKLLDSADAVFVLSGSWKKFINSISKNENVYIVYNGASLKKFEKKISHGDKINISFMGRLGKRKGVYDLLAAFEKIISNVQNAHLVLGGDGDVEKVRKLVAEKNLEDRIHVLGWVSGEKKIKVFQESDIYVLPSYYEGLPGSILEAMAAGVPIISTPVGGIPDAVIENRNGYLVNQGNIDDLYDKLQILCQKRELREDMGKESQNIIKEKFEIEKIVFDLVKLYQNIRLN
jgi:glycosyltransferase involved in cell wall biosynthesis